MQKVMAADQLANHVGALVDTFATLLNKADISAYDIQMRAGKNLRKSGDDEEDEEGRESILLVARMSSLFGKREDVDKLVINQENDIVQLLGGFLNILDHCLGTKRDDESMDEHEILRNRLLLGRENLENRNFVSRFFNIFGAEREQIQPEVNAAL